jgi:hypothetical protein
MTKDERDLVEDILYQCEQYCGGYILIDALDEVNPNPEDAGIQTISIIRKRSIKLLTGEDKEVDQIPEGKEAV